MTLGESLRAAREKAGLSQDEAAVRVGTSKTKVSETENGHNDLRVSTLARYAVAYGVPTWKLLRGVDGDQQ